MLASEEGHLTDAALYGPLPYRQMYKKPKYSHDKMRSGGSRRLLSEEEGADEGTEGRRKVSSNSDTSTSSGVSSEAEMSTGEADSGTKSSLTDPTRSLAIPGISKGAAGPEAVSMGESPSSRETAQSVLAGEGYQAGKKEGGKERFAERESSATVTTEPQAKAGKVDSSQFSNESDSATQNVSMLEEGSSRRVSDQGADRARVAHSSIETDSIASTSGRDHLMVDLDCPPHGLVSVCGRRREMEDAVAAFPSLVQFPPIPALQAVTEEAPLHFFGVYDGHGGSQVRQDALACSASMCLSQIQAYLLCTFCLVGVSPGSGSGCIC
jgi:hypothetical protein